MFKKEMAIDVQYGYLKGLANVTCEAEAEPPATFTWYRENRLLDPRIYPVHNELHTSVLQVSASLIVNHLLNIMQRFI